MQRITMLGQLIVKNGSSLSKPLEIRKPAILIGRKKGCDIRIPSPLVSREHCRITFEHDCLYAEDLQSANGTFVNGQEITKKGILRPGDRLRIGQVVLEVQYRLTERAHSRLVGEEEGWIPVEEESMIAPSQVIDDLPFLEELVDDDDGDGVTLGEAELGTNWKLPAGEDLQEFFSDLDDE